MLHTVAQKTFPALFLTFKIPTTFLYYDVVNTGVAWDMISLTTDIQRLAHGGTIYRNRITAYNTCVLILSYNLISHLDKDDLDHLPNLVYGPPDFYHVYRTGDTAKMV